MKFGVGIPNYGETLSVETLLSVSLEAEKLGYDSVWTTDHVLMPINSKTPYENMLDSITTLAYLAAQTRKVKLGISSLIIAMRNPAVAAKQLATISALSGGRVMLAIGVGWNVLEFSFLGADFHTRGKKVDESIRLIRSLWAGETKFAGQYSGVNFQDAVFSPRPSSKPTIWIGGTSKAAMKRAAEIGDAWHPNAFPLTQFRQLVSEFRQVSPSAEKKDICVRIGLNTKASQSEYTGPQGEKRILLSGNMSENRKIISELESLGVSYAVLVTSPDGKAPQDQQLQSLRYFAKEFL
ncbi:MAG: TIGR03619 family F420-dependent LLM class oxidoreductase [Nitrososphaerota archaeon]|nr:TIGR03619 family F420-dependent LLM class oxidoreductase [Nitrososphaerota archaeon]